MNGTHAELADRSAARKRIEDIVADFQRAEPAMLSEADRLMASMLRRCFPILQGSALQSGHMKGKVTIEVMFDFTPSHKSAEVRACIIPPPITALESKNVEY